MLPVKCQKKIGKVGVFLLNSINRLPPIGFFLHMHVFISFLQSMAVSDTQILKNNIKKNVCKKVQVSE